MEMTDDPALVRARLLISTAQAMDIAINNCQKSPSKNAITSSEDSVLYSQRSAAQTFQSKLSNQNNRCAVIKGSSLITTFNDLRN